MKKIKLDPNGADGEATTSHDLMRDVVVQAPALSQTGPTVLDGADLMIDMNGRILTGPAPAPGTETETIATESGWPAEVRAANTNAQNRFAHFIQVALVGHGGSGSVYRAWDSRAKQYAGLKILHSMEPTALERFTREARIAASLKHPAIATTYEVGEHGGRWYIAMKYIDGRPIDAETRSIEHNLALIRDACRALDYAHKQGIIHRDIKPGNLLVDRQGHLFLTDFGVAKKVDHDHTTSLSLTGNIIGTPKYLSPEQARGEAKRADARSDVYSLGATLYRLLAGRAPFSAASVWETIESVMKKEPTALTSMNPEVSPELERVVAKAMSKVPANRFATAGEMADELERLLRERRFSGRYGLPLYLARKWTPIAGGAVALALLFTWIAPALLPAAEAADSDAAHYKRAAMAFVSIEKSDDIADPERRSRRIREFRDSHLEVLPARMNSFLHARVLKIRASYVEGDRESARAELEKLRDSRPLDYRIQFLRTLMALDSALTQPLPMPAPEAPMADWEGSPPEWRGFRSDLQEVIAAGVDKDSLLYAEHFHDLEAARALLALIDGQWEDAYKKLAVLTESNRLPVYAAARRVAAYMARQFDEVADRPDAQFGLALEADAPPEEDLERLRPLYKGDARRELTLLAWAARRCVARGSDPERIVSEGLALAGSEDAATAELRGILQIALLRRKALSGRDDESAWASARDLLGSKPETWMGRLAAVEALIGIGDRRRIRGGDPRHPLDEAIARADSLPQEGWNAPHLLRAEALLGLGRFDEALLEAKRVQGSTSTASRIHLISSAACLRLADLARRAKPPKETGFLKDAIDFADRVAARLQDHPEAHALGGAAAVFAAQAAKDPGPYLADAVRKLTLALDRVPDMVEAKFHRAAAHFLLAESKRGDSKAADLRTAAIRDLDDALKAVPEMASARVLRGIVRGSVGDHAGSLEDLKATLDQGRFPEPEELKEWIRAAEAAKGK